MGKLTFGSLFAGIGGFDLGFERAGFECRWQVEIDKYATKVLEKRWPEVHRERDIRQCNASNLERVDCIIGGFPCQDISYAGRGAGLAGERSGLFFEAVRLVRELQPRAVVLENVAALLTRGLDRVLGTLAEIGYDAQWHCIPAASVGAPHIRDRVFILAYCKHDGFTASTGQYPGNQQHQGRSKKSCGTEQSQGSGGGSPISNNVPDAISTRARNEGRSTGRQGRKHAGAFQPAAVRQGDGAVVPKRVDAVCGDVADADLQHGERGAESRKPERKKRKARIESGGGSSDVADAAGIRDRVFVIANSVRDSYGINDSAKQARYSKDANASGVSCGSDKGESSDVADANSTRLKHACGSEPITERYGQRAVSRSSWWDIEPNVGRVANGVPKRVDRLRCLGNAIVPQVAEVVAKMTKQQIDW